MRKNIMDKLKTFVVKDTSIALILFVVAFLPRIMSLGTMYTADEWTWMKRSENFIEAITNYDFKETYQSYGITTMWLSGISMSLLGDSLFAAKLPIAIAISLTIPLFYCFLSKIFSKKIAILSALLIAFEPLLIAHSRIIHTDALVTNFTVLSLLSFVVFLNKSKQKYLIVSGILGGLAFLSKLTAFFLIPILIIILIINNLSRKKRFLINFYDFKKIIMVFLIWMSISMVVFIILYPSMWVNPIETLREMFLAGEFATKHTHGRYFFLGKIREDPGPLFYPVMLLIRLSALSLILSVVGIAFIIKNIKSNNFNMESKNMIALLCYVVIFVILINHGAKKGQRYLLPVFPVFDIFAAVGIYHLSRSLTRTKVFDNINRLKMFFKSKSFIPTILSLIVLFQALSSLTLHPYYSSYYSPLIGGSTQAPDYWMVVGWGEGMDQAARYLNQKDNAENLTVAHEYRGFALYFKGKSMTFRNALKGDADVDYWVFYICQVQRNYYPEVTDKYLNNESRTPERIVVIDGVTYAWIYKN